MPEVTIVRTEIFVVESAAPDSYGNLIVVDKGGSEHRVNQKHSSLHPVFQPGSAVEVGYGNFMNKEFIHTARLVESGLPKPQPSDQVLPEHEEVIEKARASVTPPAPQAVGMMTKEIGDMIRAEMLGKIFGAKVAVKLTEWYRSQALGITRINYDGKDLPVFK